MAQSELPAATLDTCPANSLCAIDLLAKSPDTAPVPCFIAADLRSGSLLLDPNIAAAKAVGPPLRSSLGDPPLITPLRV
jgi:hypothetical protein